MCKQYRICLQVYLPLLSIRFVIVFSLKTLTLTQFGGETEIVHKLYKPTHFLIVDNTFVFE